MSHGVMLHSKWENMNMASPQVPAAYKMDRPAYSTPPPVENTPANNECHLVELRGAKVASFQIANEQYICLPQAFDLFLKHLVGGLHTVYTKLKRLSIQPVVCNVEQVRILRGRGAIQPGVNRCKLITKKDFEILYQDCTTASRPGRPPKRYPMLPPTDLVTHHPTMTRQTVGNPLMHSNELFQQHKRVRLDQNSVATSDQVKDRRASGSPCKEEFKDMQNTAGNHNNDIPSSPAAQLAYIQALRQYQQVAASNMHNGMEVQAAGINPFMLMSHQLLNNPQQQIAMLNQFHQLQSQMAANGTFAAQMAANGQNSTALCAQSLLQRHQDSSKRNSSPGNDKESDEDVGNSPNRNEFNNSANNGNGIDGNGSGSAGSGGNAGGGDYDANDRRSRQSSYESNNDVTAMTLAGIMNNVAHHQHHHQQQQQQQQQQQHHHQQHHHQQQRKISFGGSENHDRVTSGTAIVNDDKHDDVKISNMENASSPDSSKDHGRSTEKLLSDIQDLVKVAASSASSQERSYKEQIAELKNQVDKERQLREQYERKLMDSEKSRSDLNEQYAREKETTRVLHTQVFTMKQMFSSFQQHDMKMNNSNNNINDNAAANSSPRSSPESSAINSPMEVLTNNNTGNCNSGPKIEVLNNNSPRSSPTPLTATALVVKQQRNCESPREMTTGSVSGGSGDGGSFSRGHSPLGNSSAAVVSPGGGFSSGSSSSTTAANVNAILAARLISATFAQNSDLSPSGSHSPPGHTQMQSSGSPQVNMNNSNNNHELAVSVSNNKNTITVGYNGSGGSDGDQSVNFQTRVSLPQDTPSGFYNNSLIFQKTVSQ